MALNKRPGRFWSLLHFAIRFLGLTGLLAAFAGLALADLDGVLRDGGRFYKALVETLNGTAPLLSAALVLGGGAAALLALVVEMFSFLTQTAASRSALGANAVLQVALAVVLLIGVNVWSAGLPFKVGDREVKGHYVQLDWTRSGDFTLDVEVVKQFRKLKGETTVVIYQRHRTNGSFQGQPDQYDAAAERKVIEKVKDLVEQLRELGPQFRVELLDTQDWDYHNRRDALLANLEEQDKEQHTDTAASLKSAIEAAPENSIFFASSGHVQQLSFNDFYRLDKTASKEDSESGRGNLVLIRGGVEPIANRILNLEQRKPRVGILVVHELLTSEGTQDVLTLAGARKALQAHGFEVRDVVLKKWDRSGLEATVDTVEDSKLERLQDEQEFLKLQQDRIEPHVKALEELVEMLPKASLQRINQKVTEYARRFDRRLLNAEIIDNEERQDALGIFKERLATAQKLLTDTQQEKTEITRELSGLNPDRVGEQRRLTDVRAKMERALAECDLLLVPRLAILSDGAHLAEIRFQDLDARLVAAVKDALKAGKPMLLSFGPENRPGDPPDQPDEMEKLLRELGLYFSKHAILHNAEARSFTSRRASRFRASKPIQLPPLELEGPVDRHAGNPGPEQVVRYLGTVGVVGAAASGALPTLSYLRPALLKPPKPSRPVNPLRESLHLTGRGIGKSLDLSQRFPRAMWLSPEVDSKQKFEPEVLATSALTWADDQPFSTQARPVPRFESPEPNDADNGTPDEKRQGPFTIGMAFEAPIPRGWLSAGAAVREEDAPKVRIVAIGQGNAFVGKELPAANERLLLDSCNWLLGRKDRLAHAAAQWSYPRIDLDKKTEGIWQWTCGRGLPLLFAYFGAVVLLFRRLR